MTRRTAAAELRRRAQPEGGEPGRGARDSAPAAGSARRGGSGPARWGPGPPDPPPPRARPLGASSGRCGAARVARGPRSGRHAGIAAAVGAAARGARGRGHLAGLHSEPAQRHLGGGAVRPRAAPTRRLGAAAARQHQRGSPAQLGAARSGARQARGRRRRGGELGTASPALPPRTARPGRQKGRQVRDGLCRPQAPGQQPRRAGEAPGPG